MNKGIKVLIILGILFLVIALVFTYVNLYLRSNELKEVSEAAIASCNAKLVPLEVQHALDQNWNAAAKRKLAKCEDEKKVILGVVEDNELYDKVLEALTIQAGIPPGK